MNELIYPQECTLVDADSINTKERGRQDYGDVQELAANIQDYGLIHPPTLTRRNGEVFLVAGGRRMKALELLRINPIPCLFREEMSEALLRELELFENDQRKDMTWQEKACQVYAIHRLRVAESASGGRTWSYRDTHNLTGDSLGHISHSIQCAKAILSGDVEVMNASSMTDAYKNVLLLRVEKRILEELGQLGIGEVKQVQSGGEIPVPTTEIDAIFGDDMLILDDDAPSPEPVAPIEVIEFPISEWLIHGDSINDIMPGMDPGCVDHIVTDPPYGVDLKNMEKITDIDLVADTHKVQDNLEMLPKFLTQAYRLLKKDGYCIFWYDMNHHEKLQGWARDAGFKVQEWPLVWHKQHKCSNQVAQYNWTKNVEFAMVLRKGSPTLSRPQGSCVIEADGSIERQIYSNPFAKPAAVWDFILNPIGLKGQTILDPFAGQMSCPRTVLNLGLKPLAIECDEFHYQAGVENLRLMLNEMTGGKATFR